MNSPPPANSPPHSSGDPPSLLDELIVEILSRLPVKTLIQLKCVCKSWKTLISHDPSFAKLHLHHSPRNTHLALVSDRSEEDGATDCSVVPFPISRLLEGQVTIPNDPYYLLSNFDCSRLVGSCNGLICLQGYSYTHEHTICFHLWNPATKTLSEKSGYVTNVFRLTFGYDISHDTYKVVAYSTNKVKVYSLSDNVWRDIPTFPTVPFGVVVCSLCFQPHANNGVYLSGTINWLAIRNITGYEWKNITIEQFVILSLDLATETYRQLLPPKGFVEVPAVTVLMDCLCFSHCFKGTHFVLWKMMEFGVQESWTQFLKISFQNLQIDYGIRDSLEYDFQLFLFPLYLSESDDTLIMAIDQRDYNDNYQQAILYNWRDNTVEQITSVNDDMVWFHTKDYVESLVSTS